MEAWKDIKGYEGLYQVSDLGRVKRVQHGRLYGVARQTINKIVWGKTWSHV